MKILILWVTKQIGEDHLLFGSDFPLYSSKETIDIIKSFGYPKDWLPKILGGNAMKLLKI